MMAKVLSSAVRGIEAYDVEVEVDIANGLPSFNIVGLPDAACRESADRVKAAIKNSGFSFPPKKVTVNLAPADLKKEGSCFDLPIAIGILIAQELLECNVTAKRYFCGELSLDGQLRSIKGMLPRAAEIQRKHGESEFVIPEQSAKEVSCVNGLRMAPAQSLSEVILHLKGLKDLASTAQAVEANFEHTNACFMGCDFSDIKGQYAAKRGLEIAAAGGHNVLMIGPPGSGKTMLAKSLPSILAPITFDEAMETTKIHSVAGLIHGKNGLVTKRPFRDPHHTVSDVAMVGGGTHPKPGEVSLSHNGVLFLDELGEFRRNVLEVLRQPLEESRVTITRASGTMTLPANFMLVAAMNPCPCGYLTHPKKDCQCTALQIRNYLSKVSGPLLDRIDIQIEVPCLAADEIVAKAGSENSQSIRARVLAASALQRSRYIKEHFANNASLDARMVEQHCQPSEEGMALLKRAIAQLGLSARAFHKVLKVAKTIADLEGASTVNKAHIAEAIGYRALDRGAIL